MDQTTDPAEELASLIDWLRRQPASDTPVYAVLATAFELSPQGAPFLELLSAIRTRIADLVDLVQILPENVVRADVGRVAVQVLERFSLTFFPGHLTHSWREAYGSWVLDSDATALRMFSATMVRVRPLKLISEVDQAATISAIEASIAAVQAADSFAEWEQRAVLVGLRRLHLVAKYIRIFGHDYVRRELAQTAAVVEKIKGNGKIIPACSKISARH